MLRKYFFSSLSIAVACVCAGETRAQQTAIIGAIHVIDGDTIDVGGTRIRVHGIDAPERGQPCTTRTGQNWGCGDWATAQVRTRFQGQQAACKQIDIDKYKRVVATCRVNGADMGQVIVAEGLAFAYRKYSMAYDLDEKSAAIADLGLHGFTMQSPARYRLTRIKGREAPDPNCAIKGNITAKGAYVYHMPGQAYYERTGIRPEHGERWFCSEAQARASGWRRAYR